MTQVLLEVDDLTTRFDTPRGQVEAVSNVSFKVDRSRTMGIVGESGCGKTMTALSILRLLPGPHAKIISGEIFFKGTDLLSQSEKDLQRIRGKEIGMIFQNPMTSLNPALPIGDQIAEGIEGREEMSAKEATNRTLELLELVGLPRSAQRLGDYPHEFSGGMRQRIVIAVALSGDPDLIIADEPTTALDVTVQAQILELMRDLKEKLADTIILISHDLGVIAESADAVAVMYAGRIVERGDVIPIFSQPRHPYTRGLLNSIVSTSRRQLTLEAIRGLPPSLLQVPEGCSFSPRCDYNRERCWEESPELREIESGCWAACHFAGEIEWKKTRATAPG